MPPVGPVGDGQSKFSVIVPPGPTFVSLVFMLMVRTAYFANRATPVRLTA